jgi:hypothetical protein
MMGWTNLTVPRKKIWYTIYDEIEKVRTDDIPTEEHMWTLEGMVRVWRDGYTYNPPMPASERARLIKDVAKNAKALRGRMRELRLSRDSYDYFTEEELEKQYGRLFQALNMPPSFPDDDWHLRLFDAHSDFNLDVGCTIPDLLNKLTDKELLKEMVHTPVVQRTKDAELTYMARRLAQHFYREFGETMEKTVIAVCKLIYPDMDITRNKIHSKLKGYDPAN